MSRILNKQEKWKSGLSRSAVSKHPLRDTVAKRTRHSWWYRLKWLSEVIWIFCNHRNKKLKQLSLPTNSKLNSSLVYRIFVKQLRVYSNSFRHANFVIHWFLPRCYCVEQCSSTSFVMMHPWRCFHELMHPIYLKGKPKGKVTYLKGKVFIQWHMVVIFIWCVLFVTSQFDVIFLF